MTATEELRVVRRSLAQAHRKVGKVRKIVDAFWRTPDASNVRSRKNTWAMHVALVQLAEVLDV